MRPRGRKVEPGKTFRRSEAKMWVGPESEGWCEVVISSLGAEVESEKKDANSSLERSFSKSGSLGSVINVSSYSRLFSSVAGMFVFSRSYNVSTAHYP